MRVTCYHFLWAYNFSRRILGYFASNFRKRMISKVRALCDMGVVCLESDTRPGFFKRLWDQYADRIISYYISSTLFNVLAKLFDFWYNFNSRNESFVSEMICNGWICAIRGEQCLYRLVDYLHEYISSRIARRPSESPGSCSLWDSSANRFLNANLLWPRHYFNNKEITGYRYIRYKISSNWHKPEMFIEECPLVAPLMNEFFHQTLSLQQLSRIQIRNSIGMNDFEHRVKCLSLPPSIKNYAWKANEMLADVKSFEDEISSDDEEKY